MKKLYKRILFSIVFVILLIVISIPIYIAYWRSISTVNTFHTFQEPSKVSYCDIRWDSDFLGDEKIEKIAFYIPVKIDGLQNKLFMQFDSGQQTTLLYGKTLNKLLDANHNLNIFYDKDSLKFIKNPIINIAENQFKAKKIRISKSLGSSRIDTSKIVIGTIGFDLFINRTLILDFKNDKLAVTHKSADDLTYNLEYIEGASIDKFPLLLPAKIGDKKTKLFYDTGSSMFPVLTSNKRLRNSNANKIDSLCCINNWGKQLPVYRKKLNNAIKIGNTTYDNLSIYGCEVLNAVDYLPSWYLFGMTGNKLFTGKVVVLDTKNNKFGIEN
ncbi:hypothetical protein [Tenacibaculum sp. SG-28]|uniref:hypothetical protein n=1 Tax=Tenacibaculum sp. SG-28 TaxID=754426 RepID=UPI000CF3BAA1|nr:hypothetical protein [Tenacibaculum sp. SG-28]PQJ20625.1 hypothetical protein BSU00_09950 [Tenacibaculum sp. SG-28]